MKIHKASKALATVRIAKCSTQCLWVFPIRSAAGTYTDKMVKLCTYSETCPKRSLDTARLCLWQKRFSVSGIFTLTSSSCIKTKPASNGKKIWSVVVPLLADFTVPHKVILIV